MEKRATVLTKQLCDINIFNLISYTSWLSVRGKTSCKLHKMCFRRFVGTSTSRVFQIQNGCHVNKGKMCFYSPCGSCFVVKPSVCILPLVCSLQSAFYPWSAFYPRSAVCSPQSAFYTDRFVKDILHLLGSMRDLPSMHCGQHPPGTWPGFLPFRKQTIK